LDVHHPRKKRRKRKGAKERTRERTRKREIKKGETKKANGRERILFPFKSISSAQLNLLPGKTRFFFG